MYKRHMGNHAIRMGAEYKHTDSDVEGDVSGESTFLEGKCNLGYQLTFSDKAIRPYIAVDFFYLVSTFTSAFQGGYLGLHHGYDLDNQGLGFAPALGINYRLTKSLSISWEGNIEYQWVTEKGTLTRSDPDNFYSRTTTPYNRTEYDSYWNFIKRISLNYGF